MHLDLTFLLFLPLTYVFQVTSELLALVLIAAKLRKPDLNQYSR